MKRKICGIFLAAGLLLGLAGCNSGEAAPSRSDATTTTEAEGTVTTETVNIAVLAGPTGIGSAKLMSDNAAAVTAVKYNFTVETENSNVTAGLIAGDYDIAMIATNVAANLYNKSGDIQLLAINTLGVLNILECGTEADNTKTINSVSDLAGKTVYSVGQGANPEYVLNYIFAKNGLTVGTDVFVEFMTADEITAKMLSEGGICLLPQPAATVLMMKDEYASIAVDINKEWNVLDNGCSLAMGAVAVRKEFAAANPEIIKTFLSEYAASIEYVNGNAEAASEMVAQFGIVGNKKAAETAIPLCNLVCIEGGEMKTTINNYYEILYAANPDSIGGTVPADDFYYIG